MKRGTHIEIYWHCKKRLMCRQLASCFLWVVSLDISPQCTVRYCNLCLRSSVNSWIAWSCLLRGCTWLLVYANVRCTMIDEWGAVVFICSTLRSSQGKPPLRSLVSLVLHALPSPDVGYVLDP